VKNVCPRDVPAISIRTFVTAEKLYMTKIGVKENGSIAFELFSPAARRYLSMNIGVDKTS
jgi:hypothetical protein